MRQTSVSLEIFHVLAVYLSDLWAAPLTTDTDCKYTGFSIPSADVIMHQEFVELPHESSITDGQLASSQDCSGYPCSLPLVSWTLPGGYAVVLWKAYYALITAWRALHLDRSNTPYLSKNKSPKLKLSAHIVRLYNDDNRGTTTRDCDVKQSVQHWHLVLVSGCLVCLNYDAIIWITSRCNALYSQLQVGTIWTSHLLKIHSENTEFVGKLLDYFSFNPSVFCL